MSSDGMMETPDWYRDAIIYQLHVKAFHDSNGDGIGDLRGLTEKLDYIEQLGVNTIWLLPFYPSPMRDDGYDISDYRRINKAYGTRRDFRRLIREAHGRGLRVITELVINHTSDQHPWFQAARNAPRGSAKRNYYVWSDSDEKYAGTRIIFTDTETSNWAWDPVAQQYYWHRFFSHQPDLNFANPSVVRAVTRIMRYWLDMGVDGLRLDAIPYLCEREGTTNENLPETHAVVKEMRKVVDEHYSDRMFLAEANMWPEDVLDYFGDGDECHMAYHFPLMPRMYMALAQEERHPIVEILEQTPAIPEGCQWAMFLRNHDELTLEMVTDEERDYMYETYARDPRARINVGIRRRLAPLLGNDTQKIKLLTSLLLSMPGSPILYYGDEIGMGDNIYLGDRNGVRTPMQWSPDRNAGFSRADPQQLYLPPIMDPVYGYEAVNVEAQAREVSSLLNWMRRVIGVRKSTRVFGRGKLTLLAPGNRHVFAYLREHEGETILCVANLAGTAQPVELDLSRFKGLVPVEMMGRTHFPPIGDLPYFLTLPGHEFFWFRLASEASAPEWHTEGLPASELVTLVVSERWDSFFPERLTPERQRVSQNMLRRLRESALPRYLAASRWFEDGAADGAEITIDRRDVWQTTHGDFMLMRLSVNGGDGLVRHPVLMLALAWGSDRDERIRELLAGAVARVRERARTGILFDALRDRGFCLAAIEAIRKGAVTELANGRLAGTPTGAAAELLGGVDQDAAFTLASSVGGAPAAVLAGSVELKLVSEPERAAAGLEIARFLTEQRRFVRFPRLAGELSYADGDNTTPVVVACEHWRHQGDVWRYIRHHLDRFLDEARLRPAEETRESLTAVHADSLAVLTTLGRRIGELHLALGAGGGDFAPVAIEGREPASWQADVCEAAAAALDGLAARLDRLPPRERSAAETLIAGRQALVGHIRSLAAGQFRGLKCRYHGDLHLGRVLITESDLVLTEFAADPAHTGAGPDQDPRHSPLRDIAEVLRSVDRAVRSALRGFRDVAAGDQSRLHEFAADWRQRAADALLDAYLETTADSALHGPERAETLGMIELFVIEKLLHELRHGSAQAGRDDQLALGGLVDLLAAAEAHA